MRRKGDKGKERSKSRKRKKGRKSFGNYNHFIIELALVTKNY